MITHTLFLPIIFVTSFTVTTAANPLAVGKGMTMAWQYHDQYGQYIDQFNANAYLNWLYKPSPGVTKTQHIPMVWDPNTADYVMARPYYLSNTEVVVLFNECDAADGSQCVATPEQAAQKTRELQAAFPHVKYWVSPSTHCNEDNIEWNCHYDWLRDYMAACADCQIDAINGHHYDWGSPWPGRYCSFNRMRQHLDHFKSFGLPVWITEYGCITNSESERLRVYQEWDEYFEQDDQILASYPWTLYVPPEWDWWAWSNMVNEDGSLTALGTYYGLH
jgi:hypothetical protein